MTDHIDVALPPDSKLVLLKDLGGQWEMKCVCGSIKKYGRRHVVRGMVKSCGCYQFKFLAERNRTHGMSKTTTFTIWSGMNARCSNKNNAYYKDYGGRGISVCERWRAGTANAFANFLADMGARPSKEYSIERIDNDAGYSPENCKWATRKEQARNKRSGRFIEHNGTIKRLCEWAESIGMSTGTLHRRLKVGWSVNDALTRPLSTNERAR